MLKSLILLYAHHTDPTHCLVVANKWDSNQADFTTTNIFTSQSLPSSSWVWKWLQGGCAPSPSGWMACRKCWAMHFNDQIWTIYTYISEVINTVYFSFSSHDLEVLNSYNWNQNIQALHALPDKTAIRRRWMNIWKASHRKTNAWTR